MNDLTYRVSAAWSGSGSNGEGSLLVGGQVVPYSVPEDQGGKGRGASPETLLISAVTACYSATLNHMLQKRRLPVVCVVVETEGYMSGYPASPTYSRIEVTPTVYGGDRGKYDEYVKAARLAREHCFIGQTVARGGLEYDLGAVHVQETMPGGDAASPSHPDLAGLLRR